MYIIDDTVLATQTADGIGNNITFGSFNIYPTTNSLVQVGYSYAGAETYPDPDTQLPGP